MHECSACVADVARRRLVGPALVGATPRASAVTGGRRNDCRPFADGGTIPAHLTCGYMSAWDTGSRADDRGTVSVRDDVEEFAALLRRLKDRTDRSYGSLARRLNMNTSTLHRYCAGEAVPQGFAPVERLAAF